MFAPEAAWLLGVSSIDVMERAASFSLKMGALALPRDATKQQQTATMATAPSRPL